MKCPYCDCEMEKGEVQIGDIVEARLKTGGPVMWISENECKKLLPKETIRLEAKAEGYYCNQCEKAVAFFNQKVERGF
ncbi:MAG: hypothetical protein II994_09205 [Lachnospiraceae bacterium]|nr:hypothetical protein [Lachnospiraceae bacterium]